MSTVTVTETYSKFITTLLSTSTFKSIGWLAGKILFKNIFLMRLKIINIVTATYFEPDGQEYVIRVWAGTDFQLRPIVIRRPAFKAPKPYRTLERSPAPLVDQDGSVFSSLGGKELRTTRCWTSRHVNRGLPRATGIESRIVRNSFPKY